MGKGFLQIETRNVDDGYPMVGSSVVISDNSGKTLYNLTTDQSGMTQSVPLDTPDKSTALYPGGEAYSTYNVKVSKDGYQTQIIDGVQIFDDEAFTIPVHLMPLVSGMPESETLVIPPHIQKGEGQPQQPGPEPLPPPTGRILNQCVIPDTVTVHTGAYTNAAAKNVTVSYPEYIKNVVTNEIYSEWPQASIDANILAIMSLTLNRIYTEWYRSRGYNFDITSSTATDQKFVEGTAIPKNISDSVDRLMGQYLQLAGHKEPFFSSYCDGNVAQCPGLTQWGSKALADKGYSAMEILRYFYGNDFDVVKCDNYSNIKTSYPGYVISQGSSGSDVSKIQEMLNRISTNYPAIPKVMVDGHFGAGTASAIKVFQQIFGLPQTGTVDQATWNKISYIYAAVTKIAEIQGPEGQIVGIGKNPPTSVIKKGSTGKDVTQLQFILNSVGEYYNTIPAVLQDGNFSATTTEAVQEFQKQFGLTPDGVVGPATWNKLYEVYKNLPTGGGNTPPPITPPPVTPPPVTPPPTTTPPYPGYILRYGTQGENIRTLQTYINLLADKIPSIPRVTVDGDFGTGTRNAVLAIQKYFGLTQDGLVGSGTWNTIMNNVGGTTPPPVTPPPVTAPPYPGYVLQYGAKGENVRTLQTYINLLADKIPSIPRVTVDGDFGTGTRNAVLAIQRYFGLTQDGLVGSGTWNIIMNNALSNLSHPSSNYPGYVLRYGNNGDDVLTLQTYINNLADKVSTIPHVKVDGQFGGATLNAVLAAQRYFGLNQDGLVGASTWNAIAEYSESAPTEPTEPTEPVYPGKILEEGDEGHNVELMQFFLNVLAATHASIPYVKVDGVFGPEMTAQVKAFQKYAGLSADGKIGPVTWKSIIEAYNKIGDGIDEPVIPPLPEPQYPGYILKYGSTGEDVKTLQAYINKIADKIPSIPRVTADGQFGAATQNAVLAIQRQFGLTPDGLVGAETWYAIMKNSEDDGFSVGSTDYPGAPLRQGDVNGNVFTLQTYLNALADKEPSIPGVTADGFFGPSTEASVLAAQKYFGLTEDGIVGKETWDAIVNAPVRNDKIMVRVNK